MYLSLVLFEITLKVSLIDFFLYIRHYVCNLRREVQLYYLSNCDKKVFGLLQIMYDHMIYKKNIFFLTEIIDSDIRNT